MAESWITTNKVELEKDHSTASVLYGFGAWIPMESIEGKKKRMHDLSQIEEKTICSDFIDFCFLLFFIILSLC